MLLFDKICQNKHNISMVDNQVVDFGEVRSITLSRDSLSEQDIGKKAKREILKGVWRATASQLQEFLSFKNSVPT